MTAHDERIKRALAIEQRDFASNERQLWEQTDGQCRDILTQRVFPTNIADARDLYITYLRAVVRAACQRRRYMCRTVPELGVKAELDPLRDQLFRWLDAEWGALPGRLSRHFGGAGVPPEVLELVDASLGTLANLKEEITRELDNLGDEIALDMHKPVAAASNITVNISGTVGGINFGNIAGDMNAAVNSLRGVEGELLARLLKQVTEGAANCDSLDPQERAESVEHLTAIAEEAVLPPERRKWRTVAVLVGRVGSILLKAPETIDSWNRLHAQLAAWFGHGFPGL